MSVIRFIYVYREAATGRAVYVGSAFDVAQRDREHCNKGGIPFDREIKRRGRDAFTLEIVEALKAETSVAALHATVSRENQWMDVCRTFRTQDSFNFYRARLEYDSEEHREASIAATKATCSTPEWREAKSVAIKKYFENQAARAAQSARVKKHFENPAARAAQSAAHSTPEARSRASVAALKRYSNPAARTAQSARVKKFYEDPAARAAQSAVLKKRYSNPAARTAQSAERKKYFEKPEARAAQSAVMKAAYSKKKCARALGLLPFPLKWQERYAGALGLALG